jgi:uncharacterized protein (DUF1015 family)
MWGVSAPKSQKNVCWQAVGACKQELIVGFKGYSERGKNLSARKQGIDVREKFDKFNPLINFQRIEPMAELVPWRALYYNPDKIKNLTAVVTPPYDVISPEKQAGFYDRHIYNVIRLILPRPQRNNPDPDSRYLQAAEDFSIWRQQQVLIRDTAPALFYWETEYTLEGQTHIRRAVVGLVRLESFESGVVRPHEKTFSAHKTDRFKLMSQVQAHLSTVFALYPDQEDQVLTGLKQGLPEAPMFDFADYEGSRQRFFRVTDPQAIRAAAAGMADLPIFIADGHHRYETSLAYQAWLQERYPQAPPRAGLNYVLMYLSNMLDPDLVIRPAHRLLNARRLQNFKEESLLAQLPQFFDMEPLALTAQLFPANAVALGTALQQAGTDGTGMAVVTPSKKAYILKLKPGVMNGPLTAHMPAALTKLDVVALNFLIFEKAMGLSAQELDDEETFQYSSTVAGALEAMDKGKVNLAFLLNPTRIEHVQEVASSGLIMPRKSTYFYPKVPVGLVMHAIDPNEEVGL